MSEFTNNTFQNISPKTDFKFGEEKIIEDCGFSFRPVEGFELEIDCSVYMYSEDANFEINLSGGKLDNDTSIAELNNKLAAKFLENVSDFELIESGTGTIQGITGFQNEIKFTNAEEEGQGRALICSPYINQYFFILVIGSNEYWQKQGLEVFNSLKTHIQFYPQFTPASLDTTTNKHPDLTIETYESVKPDEYFFLTIEKGDISFLLAARSHTAKEKIAISEINGPDGQNLYRYEPDSGAFSNTICKGPIMGDNGEICFFFPFSPNQSLLQGDYRFAFSTSSGRALEEIQVIIRSGKPFVLQTIDLNVWVATENDDFSDPNYLDQFENDLYKSLQEKLAPFKLAPGRIEFYHPAPDEMESFTTINLDTDLADCSYMIAESVNNRRALNIGLVADIHKGSPPTPAEVDALSSGSPGMILTTGSSQGCIVIKYSAFKENIHDLADAILQQLVIFSGVERLGEENTGDQTLILNQEIANQLRLHPIFHDAD